MKNGTEQDRHLFTFCWKALILEVSGNTITLFFIMIYLF